MPVVSAEGFSVTEVSSSVFEIVVAAFGGQCMGGAASQEARSHVFLTMATCDAVGSECRSLLEFSGRNSISDPLETLTPASVRACCRKANDAVGRHCERPDETPHRCGGQDCRCRERGVGLCSYPRHLFRDMTHNLLRRQPAPRAPPQTGLER